MIITRIEIDGFKSFVDFSLDLHPFTVLIGANASGKSNLLDAVRFLTTAVVSDLPSAVATVRGDADGLFHQSGDGVRVPEMRFGLEFLAELPETSGNRWRYDAAIGRVGGDRRLRFLRESVQLRLGDDHWFDFVGASSKFAARYRRDQGIQPDTITANGPMRRSLLGLTPITADGVEVKWMTGLAEAVAGIRTYQLEGSALRRLSSTADEGEMAADGSGLPGYLDRIRNTTQSADHPVGAIADIQLELRGLLPEVPRFEVVVDETRRDIRLEFTARNQPPFPASEASDGTLSLLAVVAALNDPRQKAPLLIDEPENGVHPQSISRLFRLMRETTSDPRHDDPDWPLRQLLIASHAPAALQEVPGSQVVALDLVSRVDQGRVSTVTTARRLGPCAAQDTTTDRGPLSADAIEMLRSAGKSVV